MKEAVRPLEHYTNPTKYNTEPYMTLWHVKSESEPAIWVQASDEPEFPQWRRLGSYLEESFREIPKEKWDCTFKTIRLDILGVDPNIYQS